MSDVLYPEDRTPPESSKGDAKAPICETVKTMLRAAVPPGGKALTKTAAISLVRAREADGCYVLPPEEVAVCFDEVVAEREAAKPGSQQPAKVVADMEVKDLGESGELKDVEELIK